MKWLRPLAVFIVILFHLFLFGRKTDFLNLNGSFNAEEEQSIVLHELPKEYLENKGQIVNNEYTEEKFDKVDSKYLGEKNQKYEKETTARVVDRFNNRSASAKVKSFSEINEAFQKSLKDGLLPQQAKVSESQGEHSRPASNNDYLNEVPLGEFTKLNTQESKYYGFYFRIRQRLESMWGMTVQEKVDLLFRGGGRLPASEENITALSVVLDRSGKIVQIILKKTSGSHELDDAAIDSFNKAGPFPNPPPGMIHEGFARIDWSFVVKG